MNITELDESNVQFYAMAHYDNPSCVDITEFHEDMARFKYLKRLLRKYKNENQPRPRLVFNHLIVLYNVFGIIAATNLLFYRIDADLHSILKTYLVFLNYLPTPNTYDVVCPTMIDDISLDKDVLDDLIEQYGNNWDTVQ